MHRNVAALAELPPDARRAGRGRALTPRESLLLLDAAKGSRMEAWITTTLLLGLRPAEVGGLTWSNVELDAGQLSVGAGPEMGSWAPVPRLLEEAT